MASIVNNTAVELDTPTGHAGSINVLDSNGDIKLASPVVAINEAGEKVDFATQTTLSALKLVADNLLIAIQSLDTGNVSGTVALDSASLNALETVTVGGSVAVSNFTDNGLTNTQLRTSPVPMSGTVALDATTLSALENINTTTNGLTDAQLRATAVPVSLDSTSLTALENVTVSGTVALDGSSLTALENVSVTNFTDNGITDAQLRASPVNVSGEVALDSATITALTTGGGLTDEQLRAAPIESQDTALYELVDTLNELVSRLSILLSARAVDGTLRVSGTVAVGSIGTITTLTTLTTLANQTALGGYLASATVQQQTNQLVQLANTANVG